METIYDMKWMQRITALFAFLAFFSAQSVGAATVTVTLEPGRLAITDVPALLIYSGGVASDDIRTLDATFSIGVTDATGKKAGWRIQAIFGPLTRADGTLVSVRSASMSQTAVTPLTGVAPRSTYSFPYSFPTDGDIIFSAAAGTGVGKSSLTFDTELTVPSDEADTFPLTTTINVAIIPGA
jgi:hypothetical protein